MEENRARRDSAQLPLARRDIERFASLLGLQRRLRDLGAGLRAQRALTHRHIFRDALTWLEIHGESSELVEHWKSLGGKRRSGRPAGAAGPADGRRAAAAVPPAPEASTADDGLGV